MRILIAILLMATSATAQVIFSGKNILSGTNSIGFSASGGGGGGIVMVQTNFSKHLNGGASSAWMTNILTSVTAGNKMIGLYANENDSAGHSVGVVTDSQGNTWTKQADAQAASSGNAEIWTATAGSSGTIYITNTWSFPATPPDSFGQSATVIELSGVESSLGGATGNATAQAAPSLGITTTRAASIIFCVVSDWSAKAPPITYRASGEQIAQDDQTTVIYRSDFFLVRAATATSYTVGETAPTAQASGIAACEIRTP